MDNIRKSYEKIRKSVEDASAIYINTREVVKAGKSSLDLKDILILGAVTGTDCLLTGKTGSGKTKLANLVMKGLFGKEYTNKTITPAMQPDDFLDIDFKVMTSGGTLQDAIKPLSLLKRPGVVLNEANRAPGVIQNYLIPFLDKEMDIQGKEFIVGLPLASGDRYQFRILTINEGEGYTVETMDKALRDRAVIEIPLDMFLQTHTDCLKMLFLQSKPAPGAPTSPPAEPMNLTQDILALNVYLDSIKVMEEVNCFLAYLSGMSYCVQVNHASKTKECIAFTPEFCTTHSCRFYKDTDLNLNNLCGNVKAPSQRALINLLKVARGLAFIRAAKEGLTDVSVSPEDISSVAPFVLYNKLDMYYLWIKEHYQGNRWDAISEVMRQAMERFTKVKRTLSPQDLHDKDKVNKYAEDNNDVWVKRIEDTD